MTTYTIQSGYDTYALAASPNKNFGSANNLLCGTGSAATVYLYMPLPPDLIGATVAHAQVRGSTVNAFSSFTETIQVKLVTSSWSEMGLTNNNQPTAGSPTTSATVNSTPGTGVFAIGVTSQIQAVASGAPWLGLQIICTTAQLNFNSLDSGIRPWVLTIDTTTAPEVPQSLVPNGTIVGSGAPILTCDFMDAGGLTNDMAAMQVQVSTSTSFTSPAFDSGTFATTVPVYDLAAGGFTPISSGVTRYWRVQVQDTDGNWSGFSDPASFTFRTQPTITVNTPAAGIVYDPTTDINATTSTNMSAYRVQVTDADDRTAIRFDSGRLPANPSALTTVDVPLPQEWPYQFGGTRVLVDDQDYQLHIRVWDTFTGRQSTPGSPSYVDSWTTFHFDDDAGVVVPDSLVADQPDQGPSITLTWTAAAAPDGWVVLRDSQVIARLDAIDVIVGVSTYSWTDPHPQQWVNHDYQVKAVSGGHQGQPSPTASIVPGMTDLYLFTQGGDQVFISGIDTSQLTVNDRRVSYKPINVRYDVDIVTGFEGVSGAVTGVIATDEWQDAIDARSTLLAIKDNPSRWVRMVYGTFSGRVLLRNVSVLPHPSSNPLNQAMSVSFGVNQVGDFDAVS